MFGTRNNETPDIHVEVFGFVTPWRWTQHVHPKRWYSITTPHGLTAQKTSNLATLWSQNMLYHPESQMVHYWVISFKCYYLKKLTHTSQGTVFA